MRVLALFEDDIWYVCSLKNVYMIRNRCSVRYRDNKKYAARVMAICHDKSVMEQVKSSVQSGTTYLQDTWELCETPGLTYSHTLRAITRDVGKNALFVDEHLLLQPQTQKIFRSLILDESIVIPDFVLKLPLFKRLERSYLNSNKNLMAGCPSPINIVENSPGSSKILSLDVVGQKESRSGILNDDSAKISEKQDSEESLVDETKSLEESLTNRTFPNPIIDETCSDGTILKEMSIGLPVFNSTMMNESNTAQILLLNLGQQKEKLNEERQAGGSTVIESSTMLNGTLLLNSDKNEKADSLIMQPISKPKYSRIRQNHEDDSVVHSLDPGKEDEQSFHCMNEKRSTAIPTNSVDKLEVIGNPKFSNIGQETPVVCEESVGPQEQNTEGLNIEGGNLDETSATDLLVKVIGAQTNTFEQKEQKSPILEPRKPTEILSDSKNDDLTQRKEGADNSTSESDLESSEGKSIIAPNNYKDANNGKSEQQSKHENLDSTHTIASTTSPEYLFNKSHGNVQTCFNTKSETSCDSEEGIDEKLIEENAVGFNTTFLRSREFPDSDQESPNLDISGKDIDPFNNNVYVKITKNFCEVNQENIAESLAEDINTEEILVGTKRKIKERKMPKIIRDEIIKIPELKTGKMDSVNDNFQKTGKIMRGNIEYNTRKQFEDRRKSATDSKKSPSLQSELETESSEAEESEVVHSKIRVRQRVLIESSESGDDDNDNEYKPSDEEEFESEEEENWDTEEEESLEPDSRIKQKMADSLNIILGDNAQGSAPDDRELLVDTTSSQTKKHFCFFCMKFQAKLARHLQIRHSNEEEVKKFITLPPQNKERLEIIATIRKNGDHLYNTNRQFNNGKLIVCRRPATNRKKTAEDFIACGNCKGQYSRNVIRHHWRRCTNHSGKNERIIMVKGRKVSGRIHERANIDVRKTIFPRLREDEVARIIRYDELCIIFANKQTEKYGSQQHLNEMIRHKLRLLGRLLIAIKSINNRITNLTDVFQPRNYDSAIEAVRIIAILDPEKKVFKKVNDGSELGTLFKQVGELLRSECIKKENLEKQKQVEDFLKLLAEDYGTSINKVVAESQTQMNRRKVVILPTSEDIKRLFCYIESERDKSLSILKKTFSLKAWRNLSEATLLWLEVFNRRRAGEMERLDIEDYLNHRGIDDMADKEIYDSLSPEGKALSKRYRRFELRGKRNRNCPVLIDSNTMVGMEFILKFRAIAGVPEKNSYVFGLPSIDKDLHRYLRACKVIRSYSVKCGAEDPKLLRGTYLRKQVATKCIGLNLEASQVNALARFMGHHEDIHDKVYRQPVAAVDIVKISKILNMVQEVYEPEKRSNDQAAQPSTSAESTVNEPSVSENDSIYEQNNSTPRHKSKPTDSSIHSNYSTPKRWTDEARSVVLSAFRRQLENGTVPPGNDIKNVIDGHDCLKGRTIAQVRTWLHTYKKKSQTNPIPEIFS